MLVADCCYRTAVEYIILLNETFSYDILEIDEDEMILSDYGIKYMLTRKLGPE